MPRRIAIINDISSFGRCSTSVILPIVSHLGVQGCAVPTALFSNHTGFESFYKYDFTDHIPAYMEEWDKLGLKFDGIMTGFLGSVKQTTLVEEFINRFSTQQTVVVVDPVMGDNGHIYPTYTPQLCKAMKSLLTHADIITPNLTEACFLTDTPYKESGWHRQELIDMILKLRDMGADRIVITGIRIGTNFIGNAVMDENGIISFQRQQIIERMRSGTGDVFASVLGADAVNGIPFERSVRRASHFVRNCLKASELSPEPLTNGICFEEVLHGLKVK